MTLNGHVQLFRRHAATIIGHVDAVCASCAQGDDKAGGPGINRVFDELFERCRRSLYDFTGRNQVNNMT